MSILLITNQNDITTDFIVRKLREKGLPFYRLNTEDIGDRVSVSFDFAHDEYHLRETNSDTVIDLKAVSNVYFRRPELNNSYSNLTLGEFNFIQTELIYTLEGLYRILGNAAWVNKVHAIRNAENKIYQLLVAKKLGFQIPESLITSQPDKAWAFYQQHQQKCIIKPIKSGQVKGAKEEGVIFTSNLQLTAESVSRVAACPVYLQPLISKKADIRVTVVGEQIFAARIHSQQRYESSVDWRRSSVPLDHSLITLPSDIEEKCIALTRSFDLQYGAIDFIEGEDGQFTFLEINPNGQWAWIESRLNIKISDAITELLAKNLAVPIKGSSLATS